MTQATKTTRAADGLERWPQLAAEALRLRNAASGQLRELRAAAVSRFDALGVPDNRDEEWKNTPTRDIANTPWQAAPSQADTSVLAGGEMAPFGPARLVLVNGRLDASLSELPALPDGVRVEPLAKALGSEPALLRHMTRDAIEHDGAFRHLNAALFEDGTLVTVADGARLTSPLQIVHLTLAPTGAACFPRTLLVAGANSEVTVIERFADHGGGRHLNIATTELVVGDNARVNHYRLQEQGEESLHVGHLLARQGRDSRLNAYSFDFGAALSRLDSNVVLDGEGARADLYGLYVTRGKQHVDNHTVLDHAKPHCDSRELFKGILDDASRTVFNGRIIVRQDAQKTDAKQSNPNLLLSREALAHTRPQLEIYADDVRCTHGATVGRLDENARFYLRARGISAEQAQRMLIHAFAGEVLDQIGVEPLRERLRAALDARLGD